mmetsp:Transcript_7221/g.19647  ORF Transcript_7221/g.19647 Transcript_7221/m.19647 type:complete len:369 (+) Transcript_7221:52-1158(+)
MRALLLAAVALAFTSAAPTCSKKLRSKTGARLGLHDVFRDMNLLREHKRTNSALLCGSGPSANLAGPAAARFFERTTDVWATNQFIVHRDLTPRFHHAEFKPSSLEFWRKNFRNAPRYKDTVFIVDDFNPAALIFLMKQKVSLFSYSKGMVAWHSRISCKESDGEHTPRPCAPLRKACSASTTLVMSLMTVLGYNSIYFVGVDLVTPDHFWTGNQDYSASVSSYLPPVNFNGDVPHEATQAAGVHPTQQRGVPAYLRGYIRFNHIKAVNLSPLSASALGLPHVPLDELFSVCSQSAARKRNWSLQWCPGGRKDFGMEPHSRRRLSQTVHTNTTLLLHSSAPAPLLEGRSARLIVDSLERRQMNASVPG